LSIVPPAALPPSAVPRVAAVHSPTRRAAIIGHLLNAALCVRERTPPAAISDTIVNGIAECNRAPLLRPCCTLSIWPQRTYR
jgi:hypothetical protein